MKFEHFERGYLLPKGCKDLIDVIKLPVAPQANTLLKPAPPPPKGDLLVPTAAAPLQLAVLLGQKSLAIIADAMDWLEPR